MKPTICNLLPIPDLFKSKSILCIQPHPDDLEIGTGATVARLAHSGIPVTCLTVTDGSAGTYDPTVNRNQLARTRRLETEKSMHSLGIDELIWLDYTDGGNLPFEAVRSDITRTIRRLKPSTIMVCDPWLPYEAHSDHLRTGMAAAEAGFMSGLPFFCPEDLEAGFEPHKNEIIAFYYTAYPNTYIDVTETWELKMAAIDCHTSQFPPGKKELLKNYLATKASIQAEKQGCDLVEALKVLSPGHLHIFEEAWQC